jgi:Mg-chelatase subunit ChlD
LVNTAMSNISNTKFNGATNIAAGADKGIAVLTGPSSRPFARKTLILLTDGNRTEGGDPVVSANTASANDIVIHTITYGASASQQEMQTVAYATGGTHYHAPDEAALEDIFRKLALSFSVTFID